MSYNSGVIGLDYSLNCTPFSPITITNSLVFALLLSEPMFCFRGFIWVPVCSAKKRGYLLTIGPFIREKIRRVLRKTRLK